MGLQNLGQPQKLMVDHQIIFHIFPIKMAFFLGLLQETIMTATAVSAAVGSFIVGLFGREPRTDPPLKVAFHQQRG